MINCYLKTSKSAMYFFPMIPSSHRFPCLLAAVREAIEVNWLLQIDLGCQYQARNQEIFRAEEVSWNKGTPINI